MIKIMGDIPYDVYLSFSGGVDSMAVAHFLKRGGRNVHLLHFDHGCEYSDKIKLECVNFATQFGMKYTILSGGATQPRGQSLEDFWRRQRYRALRYFARNTGIKFITCHHLDDAVESWLWSAMHGDPKLIPYADLDLYRPFLTTEKQSFVDYAAMHGLPVVDDPYNEDLSKMRNYIRAKIIPHVYTVNPGIKKVIRKKYLNLIKIGESNV